MFSCGVYEIFCSFTWKQTTASVLSPEVSVFVSYTSGLNCYMVLYHNSQFRLPIVPSLLLIMLCVCVFMLFHLRFLPAARRLWHTWEVRIKELLWRVFLGTSAKFIHLCFWIYHVSLPKTNIPADSYWRENEWYNVLREKIIYIDIGHKAIHIPTSDENMLKIRRLL